MQTIKWFFLDLWYGLFVYRFPPCCVAEYAVRSALGQAPAMEWLKRQGIQYQIFNDDMEPDPNGWIMHVDQRNTYWDEGDREYVPCVVCTALEPGEWVSA